MKFNFSKRETYILLFGISFVVLFIVLQFGILPVFEKRENLKRILKEKQTALINMYSLQRQVPDDSINFDTKASFLASRKKGFSLFAFLDSMAQHSNVKENVDYMEPSTKKLEKTDYTLVIVKVKLNEVYLKDIVDFLYQIESSQNGVTIISLSLTKVGKENEKLNAIIETQTLTI